jgi:hypothetical protein
MINVWTSEVILMFVKSYQCQANKDTIQVFPWGTDEVPKECKSGRTGPGFNTGTSKSHYHEGYLDGLSLLRSCKRILEFFSSNLM